MARIYLHIGSEKTGSTALQHFLSINSKGLDQDGFVYPSSRDQLFYSQRRRGHFPLAASFFQDLPDFVSRREHHDNKTILDHLKKVIEFEGRKIILSCEHFSSRLSSDHIRIFSSALSSHEVSIIFYMRPQKDLVLSSHATAVINGYRNRFYVESLSLDNPYLNYDKMLGPWAEHFGAENIIVRDYRYLLKGNVIDDFMSILGVDDLSLFSRKGPRNKAMSPKEVDFVRRINAYLPRYEEAGNFWHGYLVLLRRLLRRASFLSKEQSNADSDEALERACAMFEDSNQKVRATYRDRL